MKMRWAFAAGGLLMMTGGCVTLMDQASLARQQADFERLYEEVQRVDEKIAGIQMEQRNLAREIEALRQAPREDLVVKNRIDTLERQVRAVNAARDSDRQEIVNELSRKVASIVAASGTAAQEIAAETGYEHVVERGQSLSAIAAAYKVSPSAIKKANNMKSDVVRVGQKLFIPKP